MLQRRMPLLSLVALIALGVAVSAEAGSRKRACRLQVVSCAFQNQPVAKDDVNLICPMYPWANHGSYCSYYAIPCVNGVQQAPVNYDGACGLPPASPCDDGCIVRLRKDEIPIPRKQDVVADSLKDGFTGDLKAIGFAASTTIEIQVKDGNSTKSAWVKLSNSFIEHRKIVKFQDNNNNDVYAQLFKVTVTAEPVNGTSPKDIEFLTEQTHFIGHQVAATPDAENAKKSEVVKHQQMNTRIHLVTRMGAQHEYTVILKK